LRGAPFGRPLAVIRSDRPLLYLLPILGVLLLILIWNALADFFARERTYVVANALDDLAVRAAVYQRATADTLRAADQVARLVQQEYERTRARGEAFDLPALVRRAAVPSPGLLLVWTADRGGHITATAVPGPRAGAPGGVPGSVAHAEHFRFHREADSGRLHVGKPGIGRIAGEPTVEATRRLNLPDGSFAGVVGLSLDPAQLAEARGIGSPRDRAIAGLLGHDGEFRAWRGGPAAFAPGAVDHSALQAALEQAAREGTAVAWPNDRVKRFAAHREIPGYPLTVVVAAAERDVLAEYFDQRKRYFAYAGLASALIVLVLAVGTLLVLRLRQSQREAEAARAIYRAAAEGSLDAFLLLRALRGRDGRVTDFVVQDANARALLLLAKTAPEAVGRRLRALLPRLVRRRLYRRFMRVMESGVPLEEEIDVAWDKHGARWFRHQVVPLEGGLAITLRDIDDAKRAQQRLERLANLDSLTSLPNRRQFIEHAQSAIERCKAHGTNLGVLFIDLDNFKNVNDTLGHDVGDLLLQAVAVRLQSCVRADDVIWRLGGDEFIVTMEAVQNRAEAEVVCRRIADALGPPFVIREISISTSASIGVAFCPEDAEDANALLRNADLAMYHAKEFGSGAYQFFTEAMGVRRSARIDVEQALRGALRRYELFLVYQPQIDIATGRVTGLEALVRWQHPENGVMNPLDFIAVAEESNLIHLLGDHVFQIACAQIKRWQEAGMPRIPICVNVSPRQFQWEGIAERLLAIIEASGVSPSLLQIELTESAIMKDSDAARRKLSELKRHGVSLSVDDFGTGHSSLASLQSFPIDTLKIDRSFIERSETQEGTAILRAIVLMAHTLRMTVVAEGVETEAQLALLRRIGCDQAQGFLLAYPVLADEVPALLERLAASAAAAERAVAQA
jgi:diguanylate cyclase (GGDEF)-like protein